MRVGRVPFRKLPVARSCRAKRPEPLTACKPLQVSSSGQHHASLVGRVASCK